MRQDREGAEGGERDTSDLDGLADAADSALVRVRRGGGTVRAGEMSDAGRKTWPASCLTCDSPGKEGDGI